MTQTKTHTFGSRTLSTAALIAALALGLSACSDTSTTTSETPSSPSASSESASIMAPTESPAAASIVPPPLVVTRTDTSIALVPGQLAEWANTAGAGRALVLSSDQSVFTGVPRNPGSPLLVQAVGEGVAVARVFIDSTIPVQVLTVTVTAD